MPAASHAWDARDFPKQFDPQASDIVGERLEKRSKLRAELDAIRKTPGMERIFGSPTYDILREAMAEGPIIIVNHSKHRSDVLILHYDHPPIRVALDNGFYQRTTEMAERLRRASLESQKRRRNFEKALRDILEELWGLLGRPVRDALVAIGLQTGSRVWWCPTSAVSFLPLHASGPELAPSSQRKKYFQDFYISSYTPTIGALLDARKRRQAQPETSRSLLVIAHPAGNLKQVEDEVRVLQDLRPKRFRTVKVLHKGGANRSSVMRELFLHPWVHIACHGTLTPGEPFKSAFRLSGDERLMVADIMRSHIPAAEFAFLSACHTAGQAQGSATEEVVQLAAAMQFCGYKSVIGTMWAMYDDDGPTLVRDVYQKIFEDAGRQEEVGYKRAARALYVATKQMRKDGARLDQWVNFVHIGA